MRRFLVTGGAGFIGSHIATALVQRGDQVRVLDNLSTGFQSNLEQVADKVELIEGDITDADTVGTAAQGVDFIFHHAALASVPRCVEFPLDTNDACVTGTVNVLDQARRAGVRRVVYAASSSAYGDQPYSSKRECDLPAPLSPYAVAKLAGEARAR
jgi:UDP-glucose 4-epimerase